MKKKNKNKNNNQKKPKPNFTYWIKKNASSIWNLSINKIESFFMWPHLFFKGLEEMVFHLKLMTNFGIE